MSNVFDGYKANVFDIAAQTMGYDSLWIPSDGSVPDGYTARVLFNNPSEKKNLAGIEYDPRNWKMEYRFTQFPGLKDIVDTSTTEESVTINGHDYWVRAVDAKFDGDTYIAILEPK